MRWRLYRSAEPHRGFKTAAPLFAFYVLCVALAGLFAADHIGLMPFWPAAGVLVAALLLLPQRLGVIFCLGAMATNTGITMRDVDVSLALNITYAVLSLALAFAVATATRSLCGAAMDFARLRRLVTFTLICVFAAAVEALIGVSFQLIALHQHVSGLETWFWWSVCDFLGLLFSAPAILLLMKSRRYFYKPLAGRLESWAITGLFVVILAASLIQNYFPCYTLLCPILVLIAARAGPPGAACAVLVTAACSAMSSAHGLGPFAHPLIPTGLKEGPIQLFMFSAFVSALPTASYLGDRNRAARRLERAHAAANAARARAEIANESKSQFVANMSHEIRTPLNGVLGMAQVMANDELPPVQRERLEVVQRSGEMLLAILNDILDLAKIEAGRLTFELIDFDISDIGDGARAAFTAIAHKKGLSFDLAIDKAASGSYVGDPTRLRQIIYNLVSNSIKFTDTGEVRVCIGYEDDLLVLSVTDSGVGIAPERVGALFTKFEQADASITRRFGGTGIGLYICRQLAVLMGGDIVAESALGAGSTFTVKLPLARAAAQAETPVQAEFAATTTGLAGEAELRVLAAEDNEINRLVLKTLLHQVGVQPTLVEDGAQAVEAWREGGWDLILMDVQMPVMDGVTATELIRRSEVEQGRPRTPVIALTANVMAHQEEHYRLAGVDRVVGKPIKIAELLEAMSDVLSVEAGGEMGLAVLAKCDCNAKLDVAQSESGSPQTHAA